MPCEHWHTELEASLSKIHQQSKEKIYLKNKWVTFIQGDLSNPDSKVYQTTSGSDSLACQVSLTSLTILLGMIHTSSFKASLQKNWNMPYAFWPYINQDKSKSKCLAALYPSKGTQSIEKAKSFLFCTPH